jgi:hypothetical protein
MITNPFDSDSELQRESAPSCTENYTLYVVEPVVIVSHLSNKDIE